MTPQLLREIGEALDGEWWIRRQAARRGVAARTVERWASGASQMPEGIPGELVADLDAKIAELRALRRKLRS